MKKFLFVFSAFTIAAFAFAFSSHEILGIGDKAPLSDKAMKDISGKEYSLDNLKKENGLLVVFSCNTCPFALGWEDTYPELGKLTEKGDIGMVIVNSNAAKRDKDDSLEEMVKHAKEAGYNTPYVVDDKHVLADAFGAQTTPHIYLFNGDMKLVYRGLIDDRYDNREKKVNHTYLKDAIKNLANGKAIEPAVTAEKGCSIKRIKA